MEKIIAVGLGIATFAVIAWGTYEYVTLQRELAKFEEQKRYTENLIKQVENLGY